MSVSDLRREPDLRHIASVHAPTYLPWRFFCFTADAERALRMR